MNVLTLIIKQYGEFWFDLNTYVDDPLTKQKWENGLDGMCEAMVECAQGDDTNEKCPKMRNIMCNFVRNHVRTDKMKGKLDNLCPCSDINNQYTTLDEDTINFLKSIEDVHKTIPDDKEDNLENNDISDEMKENDELVEDQENFL